MASTAATATATATATDRTMLFTPPSHSTAREDIRRMDNNDDNNDNDDHVPSRWSSSSTHNSFLSTGMIICRRPVIATAASTMLKTMTRTADFSTMGCGRSSSSMNSSSSLGHAAYQRQFQQTILACSSSSTTTNNTSSSKNRSSYGDDYYISPQIIQERLIDIANQAGEAASSYTSTVAETISAAVNNNNDSTSSSTNDSSGSSRNNSSKSRGKSTASTKDGSAQSPSETDGPYGPLCQYRRGFFEHLHPKAFFRNSIKLTLQQSIITLANFFSEQLEGDLKRTKLIDEGQLTPREAEQQAEEWERIEWNKRWRAFPHKLLVAFAKYHAVTITLRLYESICALFCSAATMDQLTMDFFAASRTLATNLMEKDTGGSNITTMTSAVRSRPFSVMGEMTVTTFWSNLLITLSDYSVHQILLCYGYYKYYERQRKRLPKKPKSGTGSESTSAQSDVSEADVKELQMRLTDHLLTNSTKLLVSRGCGLLCGSFGSGIGTIIRPGWGTLMISSMAEGMAPSLVDDGSASVTKELTSDKPKTE